MQKRPDDSIDPINPYASLTPVRTRPETKFHWPFPRERRFEVQTDIDVSVLNQCLRCEVGTVRGYRQACGLLFLGALMAWSIVFVSTPSRSIEAFQLGLVALTVTAIGCFLTPRSFYVWHVRRLWYEQDWMWGQVAIKIDWEGIHWQANGNLLALKWDSLVEVFLSDQCVWVKAHIPWTIRLPIHRSWLTEPIWRDLLQACRFHNSAIQVNQYFRYRNSHWHKYVQVGFENRISAKELSKPELGDIGFRTPNAHDYYGSERTYAWLLILCIVPGMFFFIVGFLLVVSESLLFKSDYFMRHLSSLRLLPMFWPVIVYLHWFIMPHLPFGIKVLERAQTCIGAQSGSLSKELVRLESHYHSMELRYHSIRKIIVRDTCLILDVHANRGQAIVIPRDQFCESDAKQAWVLISEKARDLR